MQKDLHSLTTCSIIYTERNKGKQKEYPYGSFNRILSIVYLGLLCWFSYLLLHGGKLMPAEFLFLMGGYAYWVACLLFCCKLVKEDV
jgi:hypothetical protein